MITEKKAAAKGWKSIGERHHHGIQMPLLSLRSANSCGNGEFLDLLPIIDWLASMGMDLLQLLPLNDSGQDASPYNALSASALHPIYLSLHALPHLSKNLSSFKPFNQTKGVSYWKLLEKKMVFLKEYIADVEKELLSSEDYNHFLENTPHFFDYALYKVLKEKHEGKPWKKWDDDKLRISHTKRERLMKEHEKEMQFHLMIQYLCHCQLKKVKEHAEKKGVFLKGDIPILLSCDSADVWAHQEFFDLSQTAGSPPDLFNPNGQHWMFPLYHWKAMEENHFEWWRKRIEISSRYFHLYRLDHILGFFRIWAIPLGKNPKQGAFIPSDPLLMEAQGKKLLETLLSFSSMLPIGEDLGIRPPFIKKAMEELGIAGTRLFTEFFIRNHPISPLSLSSASTHDTETLSHWWKKHSKTAKAYAKKQGWHYEPTLSISYLTQMLRTIHHSPSLFHINLLQEYLALTPEITWERPEKERINTPGTMSRKNWTYRYKPSIELLTSYAPLKEKIIALL